IFFHTAIIILLCICASVRLWDLRNLKCSFCRISSKLRGNGISALLPQYINSVYKNGVIVYCIIKIVLHLPKNRWHTLTHQFVSVVTKLNAAEICLFFLE
ncbi:MAG: hypothetical protein NC350_05775, partial [Corallococcus sp.]|nr:hypothetical protein [Corallococcus sp.]